jgi:hypothetical protein
VLTSGWRDVAQSREPPPQRRVAATVGPSPYQQARTLVLLGGDEQAEGMAMLSTMGIAQPED